MAVQSSVVQRPDGIKVSTAPAKYAKCSTGTGAGLVSFSLPDNNQSTSIWIENASVDASITVSFDDGTSSFTLGVGDSIGLDLVTDHVQITGAYRMIVSY